MSPPALVNATTNALIQTVTLTKQPPDPLNPTAPVQWDNTAAPASFTMPASDNVYVQPFLSDCNGTGQIYDDGMHERPTGLLMINNHPATNPTVANGTAPQLNAAGVSASGTLHRTRRSTSARGGCSITVNAGVTFASERAATERRTSSLLLRTWDPATGAWVTSRHRRTSTDRERRLSKCANTLPGAEIPRSPTRAASTELVIDWEQTAAASAGLRLVQRTRADSLHRELRRSRRSRSAPATAATSPTTRDRSSSPGSARPTAPAPSSATTRTASPAGSTHSLVFTFKLSGLNTAAPADPPTVLRFANSTNHQTGLINCGQGNGGSNDAQVVYYGCGPGNPLVPGMNPLFVYSRPPGSDCSPATDGNTTGWPNGNNQDCVETTPGQRRNIIICALVDRIVNNPYRHQLHRRGSPEEPARPTTGRRPSGRGTSCRVTRARSR